MVTLNTTGLDGKAPTVAIVQAELVALEIYVADKRGVINRAANKQRELLTLAAKERRMRLCALLHVLESEQGMLPLDDLEASLDATDDGTMDVKPTLRPEADDGMYQGSGDDLPEVEDRTPGAGA